ncbi:hypothetical protein B9Z55_023682 [Caenorhabditis nigoni]|uniref:F-box domain-containing protein n=1 Tax=Caenorhabditis nigoni TaxID=1611254 RepID=A0A2G5SQR6_9PELO|nr:hypothetical protein B9Z55_023682 [Caenorhabditis nigoni]
MPINLLSLPVADLQYTLKCMNLGDLIAFSLCSKRTKSFVKSSNRKIDTPSLYISENRIRLKIIASDYQELQNNPDIEDQYLQGHLDNISISLDLFHSSINVIRENGLDVWIKQEITQQDWITHILSIFNESMIYVLEIQNIRLSDLDTVKQFIPQCQTLTISPSCSEDVAKIAFHKLYPIIEKVEIEKNIFANEIDISQFLTPNLKSLSLIDFENPFKITSDDLLAVNITDLSIEFANITEKEMNRFLKLWMKGNHTFNRTKFIRLTLDDEFELNHQEVFKGIQYEFVEEEDYFQFQMRRGDGKKLLVLVEERYIAFNFA